MSGRLILDVLGTIAPVPDTTVSGTGKNAKTRLGKGHIARLVQKALSVADHRIGGLATA